MEFLRAASLRSRSSLIVCILLAFGVTALAEEPTVGVVKAVRGEVFLFRASKSGQCQTGTKLIAGDTIRTLADSSAGIMMLDGTRLGVGEKSAVIIKQYVFSPSESKYSLILEVLNGVMAYISGKIAHLSPAAVEIQTPVGIVGTRGTVLAMKVEGATP